MTEKAEVLNVQSLPCGDHEKISELYSQTRLIKNHNIVLRNHKENKRSCLDSEIAILVRDNHIPLRSNFMFFPTLHIYDANTQTLAGKSVPFAPFAMHKTSPKFL